MKKMFTIVFMLFVFCGFASAVSAQSPCDQLRKVTGDKLMAVEVSWDTSVNQPTNNAPYSTAQQQYDDERETRRQALLVSAGYGYSGIYGGPQRQRQTPNNPIYSGQLPTEDLVRTVREEVTGKLLACGVRIADDPRLAALLFEVSLSTKKEIQQHSGFDGRGLQEGIYEGAFASIWFWGGSSRIIYPLAMAGAAAAGQIESRKEQRGVEIVPRFKLVVVATSELFASGKGRSCSVTTTELDSKYKFGKNNSKREYQNSEAFAPCIGDNLFPGVGGN